MRERETKGERERVRIVYMRQTAEVVSGSSISLLIHSPSQKDSDRSSRPQKGINKHRLREARGREKEKRSGNYDAGLPSFSLSISGDLLETGECQLCALCVTDCGFTYKDIPAKKVHNRHESSKGAKSLCVMRDMWLASGSIPFNFLSFF